MVIIDFFLDISNPCLASYYKYLYFMELVSFTNDLI